MWITNRILKAVKWLLIGTPDQKRRVRLEIASLSAGLLGDFYLGDDCKIWRQDQQFLDDCRRLSPTSPYSQERKYLLRELVRAQEGRAGQMAECGCYEGASAWFMTSERPETPLHLFDSFEGLSDPGSEDVTVSGIRSWEKGDMRSMEAKTRATLREFPNVEIHKGWIPSRFVDVENEHFCFVHIDVDLYQPTWDSLDFFYPRTISRGVLLLDDYGFATCPGAFSAVNEFMADKPETVVHCPTGQGIVFKE